MANDTSNDLWKEFEEGELNHDDSSEKCKKTAVDGSEWAGKYDRRSQPRADAEDSGAN